MGGRFLAGDGCIPQGQTTIKANQSKVNNVHSYIYHSPFTQLTQPSYGLHKVPNEAAV
jgi:hypothetical protein